MSNKLDWTATAGSAPLAKYYIYRSVSGGPYSQIAIVNHPTLTYTDTAVDLIQFQYDYYIRSQDAIGNLSPPSNIVHFDSIVNALLAIGGGGAVIVSDDGGDTWWWVQNIASTTLGGIAYSPTLDRYVIVTSSGIASSHFASSEDALFWTLRTGAFTGGPTLRDVTWASGLSLFVAVDDSSSSIVVNTSPDGIVWTGVGSTPLNAWRNVVWNNVVGVLVAVAPSGGVAMMTSLNATSWISPTISLQVLSKPDINGARTIVGSTSASSVARSDNGILWTEETNPDIAVSAVAYSPTLNMWVGIDVAENVTRSIDNGVTWSAGVNMGFAGSFAFGNYALIWSTLFSKFVTLATSGVPETRRVAYSTDGVNWTQAPVDAIPAVLIQPWRRVIDAQLQDSPVTWIALHNTGSSSDDAWRGKYAGGAWRPTTGTLPGTGSWGDVVYIPGATRWVAVTVNINAGLGDDIITSDDQGMNWTLRNSGVDFPSPAVAYSPTLNRLVAVKHENYTSADEPIVMYSNNNGVTWTPVDTGTSSRGMGEVIWVPSKSKFFMAGAGSVANGRVAQSSDGITWTWNSPVDSTDTIPALAYASDLDQFCVIGRGSSDGVWTSTDFTSWTEVQTTPPWQGLLSLLPYQHRLVRATALGLWVFAGNNRIYTSPNAVTWTERLNDSINRVTYSEVDETLIAVGGGTYTIYVSFDGINWLARINTQILHTVKSSG